MTERGRKLALYGLAAIFVVGTLVFVNQWRASSSDSPDNMALVVTPAATNNDIMRIADIDFGSYNRGLAKFVGVAVGDPVSQATSQIENYFTPRGGDAVDYNVGKTGQETETTFSSFDGMGGRVMIAERINMRDDSVAAEQFYAVFKKSDAGEYLVDYGLKIKCHRGENTQTWQTQLCP